MANTSAGINTIHSVKEAHSLLGLPGPLNPLITVIDHAGGDITQLHSNQKLAFDLYNISIKRSFKGIMKYGKNNYDFDEGTMSFIAPNQVIQLDSGDDRNRDGWSLLFHPDLIRQYPLAKAIKNYGFFAYGINEALHLSDAEEKTIEIIIQNISNEINARLDNFSQDVIVSNIELLLSYSNRFYGRQFLTRKMGRNDLLASFESLLEQHFADDGNFTLPTVEQLASQLNVSAAYLRDMLKTVTGQNTQQHIHNNLIEKAKQILTSTDLGIGEIAYQLGFEYPQSFSKLFKNKTSLSPLEYRKSYN